MKVLVLATGCDPSEGGIQSYAREIVLGLLGLGHEVRIVSTGALGEFERDGRCVSGMPRALQVAAFAAIASREALLWRPEAVVCVHLHLAPVALLLRMFAGVRYVVALHGIEAWQRPSALRLRSLRGAACLAPVSDFTRQSVLRWSATPGERFATLPNTYDEDLFHPGPRDPHLLRELGIGEDAFVLLTVGRMASSEAYKGHDAVIRALCALRQRVPRAVYVVAGGGDDRGRLEGVAKEYGVDRFVRFAGWVPRHRLPDFYRSCDVYVMPSSGEGFGISYLEAQACGKPVVTGCADAGAELANRLIAAASIDPSDGGALLSAITSLAGKLPERDISDHVARCFGRNSFRERLRKVLGDFFRSGRCVE